MKYSTRNKFWELKPTAGKIKNKKRGEKPLFHCNKISKYKNRKIKTKVKIFHKSEQLKTDFVI